MGGRKTHGRDKPHGQAKQGQDKPHGWDKPQGRDKTHDRVTLNAGGRHGHHDSINPVFVFHPFLQEFINIPMSPCEGVIRQLYQYTDLRGLGGGSSGGLGGRAGMLG